jgi:hypothetical protein
VPVLAAPLRQATQTFDEIWYGGRAADATAYAALVGVDELVAGTRVTGS